MKEIAGKCELAVNFKDQRRSAAWRNNSEATRCKHSQFILNQQRVQLLIRVNLIF